MTDHSEAEKLIAEMRAGLGVVTEGPWEAIDNGTQIIRRFPSSINVSGFSFETVADLPFYQDGETNEDGVHLAHCSPDNIRLLLDTLSAALAETERLKKALRNIAEGNLGDDPWQANYAKIREVAARALAIPTDVPLSGGGE